MKQSVYENCTADYYDEDEVLPDSIAGGADYIFADVSAEDIKRIERLKDAGFVFHDRTILTVIQTTHFSDVFRKYVRYEVTKEDGIIDDIMDLAVKSFPTDRRFHFGADYDNDAAALIIQGYLKELSQESIEAYCCRHNGKLIGFVLLKRKSDDGIYENLLGAVEREYRGAAMSLYVGTLLSMKEKGYRAYWGWISSKNTASLNLHTALGGKFERARERYRRIEIDLNSV